MGNKLRLAFSTKGFISQNIYFLSSPLLPLHIHTYRLRIGLELSFFKHHSVCLPYQIHSCITMFPTLQTSMAAYVMPQEKTGTACSQYPINGKFNLLQRG